MDKQKARIKKLLLELGCAAENADALVNQIVDEAGEDPSFTEVILSAQEHFKPVLKSGLQKEFNDGAKARYTTESINKIVEASKGKLRRVDYEGKPGGLEEAIAALLAAQAPTGDESEITTKYNAAVARIQELETSQEQAVAAVRAEFEEKENGRLVFDGVLSHLGSLQNPGEGKVGKKLSVAQDHAARAILRELGDEYALKYDTDGKKVGVYNKKNPGEIVVKDGKVVDVDSLIMESLTRNNWIAQSNGGTGANNPALQHFNIGSRKSDDSEAPKDVNDLAAQMRDNIGRHKQAS
jgi:hypothetical protein